MKAVSAVVVNYNAREHLLACVASLEAAEVDDIVVMDNGPDDGSGPALSELHPGVRFVRSGGNIGYGRAANAGAALSGRPYLLVCNPDVVLGAGAVGALVAELETSEHLGLVGPRIVGTDGALYPSARLFPDLVDAFGHGALGAIWKSNPYSRRYKMSDWDHAQARTVDWVSGACFLARRTAWDQVGGFDPGYFMYMEDVDLCWRLGRAGWQVGYQPRALVAHVQGASADLHPYRMTMAHHVSMWRFAWRTATGARRWALPLVGVGVAARLGVLLAAKWAARAAAEAAAKSGRATRGPGAG